MENYSIIILILVIMIGFSAVAEKIKIPGPIVLITVGIIIGWLPFLPDVHLDPEIVMLLFLPPLLYDAAFNISFASFKTHLNTISSLAIGLVFVTTVGIGVVAHYIIPNMSWSLAFVLGAILSATDAVAAIGITKDLKLSHATLTILEGESLINDASALTAYRFSVAAVTGVAFVWWEASIAFVIVLLGGLGIGILLANLLSFILKWFRTNYIVIISFMLLMPFTAYLIAEYFNVSGVIAVVVLGLGMSRLSKAKFPEDLKKQSHHFWEVNIFVLNGVIFMLIGLQFPIVLKHIAPDQIFPNIGYAVLISITALAIRFMRVFLQRIQLVRGYKIARIFLIRKKNIHHHKRYIEKANPELLLDFESSLIISWSGIRGIVSLAIALGLPTTLDNGKPFPQRDTIIFISVVVVLFNLLGQGLTLPWIVRKLKERKKKESLNAEWKY